MAGTAKAPLAATIKAAAPGPSSSAATSSSEREKDAQLMYGAAEAQWILTVLDDASNKLSLTSYLTPDILKDSIMDAVDHEMVVALKEHFEVEKQYAELLNEQKRKLDEDSSMQLDEQTQAMLNELDLCLSDSTRTVARLLKMNPLLVRRLREVCSKRKAPSLEFINTFARLRKLVHNKLRMSAEEERQMKEQLEKLQEEEEEDTKRFLELTEGLAGERNEHKQTLAGRDRKILRLKKQIEQWTHKTQTERQTFNAKMKAESEAFDDVYRGTKQDLGRQLRLTTEKLEEDGGAHWTEEQAYHRRKYNKAMEVERLVQTYDRDMMEKHEAHTQLKKVYEEEKEELATLREYFEEVDTEVSRQEEEIRVLTERRDAELVAERKRHQAALVMQSMFRQFTTKAMSSKPKKAADPKKKK